MEAERLGVLPPWALPVYGALIGALVGFAVGYLTWRHAADPKFLCVDVANSGRCPADKAAERWTLVGGGIAAVVGLALGTVLQSRRTGSAVGETIRAGG
jgi:ABC-type branched-subunit amino acid transport system permease subunit